MVRVGKYRSQTVPEGFELAVEGGDRGQYSVFIKMQSDDVENIPSGNVQCTKELRNGQLYIRVGENVYDILGNRVE